MDLARSWAVALLTLVAGTAVTLVMLFNLTTVEMVRSLGGRVLALYFPAFGIAVGMAAFAALAHPAPARDRSVRHAFATMTVPAVVILLEIVNAVVNRPSGESAVEVFVAIVTAVALGALVGWQLVDRLRASRSRSVTFYDAPTY